MSNCFDCKPSGFGNAVVPPNPRGYYRSLWQMEDALGCPRRMYPSAFLDCAGWIEKNDNWDPLLLGHVFQAVVGSPTIASGQIALHPGGADVTAAAIYFYFSFMNTRPNSYGWVNVRNLGSGNAFIGLQFKIVAGNFTYYDMRDMSSFAYNAPPSYIGLCQGDAIILNPPDFAGSPWWNPV